MTFTVSREETRRGREGRVRTRETERKCSKRIRPCVPPINREKKSVFLGRNGKEPEYIQRYYEEKDEAKRREKGRGGGKKSEAEIAGGIARVGTPFLRDLYRGGGACKVART